jgi:lipopolysaccharide biosynthesis protein
MKTLTEIVVKARAGAESLKSKASELRLRAVSLRDEIDRADGSAAAAIAMGVEKADPGRESKVAAKIAELAAVEKDLADTTRAQAAAPALFERYRAPLTEAVTTFESEYASAERALKEWASEALSILARATAQTTHFAHGIQRCGAVAAQSVGPNEPPGHPMALFPQLTEFNHAIEAARSADRPLVAPVMDDAPDYQRERVISISGGRN